jgi:hypothetical protein
MKSIQEMKIRGKKYTLLKKSKKRKNPNITLMSLLLD